MQERVFTLEANGIPILCFPAGTHREAQSLLKEVWLLSDLRTIKSRDKPVWDGQARLSVRQATPEEISRFTREKKDTTEDDLPIVYLVPLY
jgi:hypothetical protein